MRSRTRKPATRAYDGTRRREAAGETRAAILAAATELLKQTPPDQLAYADIALASRIGLRTIYRHFPEQEGLLAAAAEALLPRLLGEAALATDPAGAARQMASLHRALCREPSLYALFFATPMRSQSAASEAIQTLCSRAMPDLPAAQQAALCGLIDLLLSPYAWQILHRRWKLPAEAVTQACMTAMQAVFDAVASQPDSLNPKSPPPPRFRAGKSRSPRS